MHNAIGAVDAHWAAHLNCAVEDLYSQRVIVTRHPRLVRYPEALLFRRGATCIIAAPDKLVASLSKAKAQLKAEEGFDKGLLESLFGSGIEQVVGPAWIGYADEAILLRAESCGVRLLNPDEESPLRDLAESCSPIEWEHSDIEFTRQPICCRFLNDQAVAAASYRICKHNLAHIGVISHPAYRGRGYGKAVVSGISEQGLSRGLVMQYRTLESNAASVAIARSLGFQLYAETIAVVLNDISI
jgi:RimJ/RimL family protein N-acetyltransferase